ncbi:MAG: hypothetical protein WAV20_06600, partial [Blastocatellia bacterium]
WRVLVDYGSRIKKRQCGCQGLGNEYDRIMEWYDRVREFAQAPAGNFFTRKLYSIESVDPSYLENKRRILGVPRRSR